MVHAVPLMKTMVAVKKVMGRMAGTGMVVMVMMLVMMVNW